jgi:DNA-binding NarL/FixJ family response regulator
MRGYVSLVHDSAALGQAVAAAERSETVIHVETRSGEGGAIPVLVSLGGSTRVSELDGEILRLLAHGSKDKGIAEGLGFSESYIRHRVQDLERRFAASTRFQLGCWAVWYGLAEPGHIQGTGA